MILKLHRAGRLPSFSINSRPACLPHLYNNRTLGTYSRFKHQILALICTATLEKLGTGELVAGIDLGTTNSCIAITRGRKCQIVPDSQSNKTLPSVVAFLGEDDALIGASAKRYGKKDPANVFTSVKRFIGQELDAVSEDASKAAFEICKDEDGQVVLACNHAEGGTLYPEEISARIVAQLLANAEAFADGHEISKAVISVPAYFNESQREATITAGEMAGLQTIKLIKEPVAAALAYGVNVREDQTVLVLDLGGGTFDVSLLEVGGGCVEVLSIGGDPHLGGDDWDYVIIDWLVKEYLQPEGIEWREPAILSNLKSLAEAAKVKLSSEKLVTLRMPVLGPGMDPVTAQLSQQQFEALSAPLFRRLRLPVDACCWQAGVDLEDAINEHEKQRRKRSGRQRPMTVQIRPRNRPPVSRVLLVGGATRMPAFRRFVQHMTGLKPDAVDLVDPDLAVAIGAAVHAGSLQDSSNSRIETLDVWKAALTRALASKRLKEDEALAEALLGEEAEVFRQQRTIQEGENGQKEDELG